MIESRRRQFWVADAYEGRAYLTTAAPNERVEEWYAQFETTVELETWWVGEAGIDTYIGGRIFETEREAWLKVRQDLEGEILPLQRKLWKVEAALVRVGA